jgi:RNA polymerase sigma-70 factor (ECF subfamily)
MDDDRFRRLVAEFSPGVANFIRRRLYPLTDADLDDLVDETFLVVWRRIDDVPLDSEFPWILGVARNVLRNARRAQRRRRNMESALEPSRAAHSAEAWVLASASVREAMQALKEGDRDILMLRFWDGMEVSEIAVVLSVSVTATNVRLSRARDRFRVAFNSEEETRKIAT